MKWRACRLGDVLTLKRGHDLPSDSRRDGEVPVVSSSGITGYHSEAKAEAPGVVTGRYGTLGEVFYLERDYWPLNTALYVVDFKGTHPRFAAYFLKNILRDYQSDKAAVPGVDRNVLHELKVRCPEREFQEAIASILSAYDDMIENNRRRMTLLEESARLLYREWFVRLRFPGHEHTRIVDGLPEGWRRMPLGEITTKIGSGATPRGGEASYFSEGIPLIRSLNVYDDRFDDEGLAFIGEDQAAALANVTVESRDILLNITGASVARCCMAPERYLPARVNQHVMIIRVDAAEATKWLNLRDAASPMFYGPFAQDPTHLMVFALRGRGNPASLAASLAQLARRVDPGFQVTDAAPFTDIEDRTLVTERLVAQVSTGFGALALLVACVGLYGILAYSVARRTREIGLRLALGATRAGVLWMVLRESLALVGLGFAIGIPAALAASRLIRTMLYGLTPTNPATIGAAFLILLATSTAAAYIPARRAASVDPMTALRHE